MAIVVSQKGDEAERLCRILRGDDTVSGECLVNHISSRSDRAEYVKLVECLDTKEMQSQLSVRDYLFFYAMVSGCYKVETDDTIRHFFRMAKQEEILQQKIDALDQEKKIMVRFLVAYLKGVRVFIGNSLLETLETEGAIKKVLEFMQHFATMYGIQCIMLEEKWNSSNWKTLELKEYRF